MDYVKREVVNLFANNFAGKGVGFSAKEIYDYFCKHSTYINPIEYHGIRPSRVDYFIECVYFLSPKKQYYALNDLAFLVHNSKYEYPDKEICKKLLVSLHSSIPNNPLGIRISKLRETAFREDWVNAINLIEREPAKAITAGRTMLETVLKTIIKERGGNFDQGGNLSKLLKETENVLSFNNAQKQAEHQILSGLVNITNGISTISNDGGDRHGTVMGKSIESPSIAELIVNAAGVLGVTFIDMHLLEDF